MGCALQGAQTLITLTLTLSLKHNLNLNLKPAKQLRSIPQPRLHSPGTLSVLRDLISTQGRCIGSHGSASSRWHVWSYDPCNSLSFANGLSTCKVLDRSSPSRDCVGCDGKAAQSWRQGAKEAPQ